MREQVTIITITCDGCGTELKEGDALVVNLAVGKRTVVADLCDKCGKMIQKILEKTKSRKSATDSKAQPDRTAELRPVREWAAANGRPCPVGRVPAETMRAYKEATAS